MIHSFWLIYCTIILKTYYLLTNKEISAVQSGDIVIRYLNIKLCWKYQILCKHYINIMWATQKCVYIDKHKWNAHNKM